MREPNSIDLIARAARDGKLSIDAAAAEAICAIIDDPLLMNAAVKRMIFQIAKNEWDWAEPPLAQLVSDLDKARVWLAGRKEAGKRIDPDNAEVTFWWAQTLDPYGVWPDLPDECKQVGREYFARARDGEDGWVSFHDLPKATLEELRRKMKAGDGESDGWVWRSRKKAASG